MPDSPTFNDNLHSALDELKDILDNVGSSENEPQASGYQLDQNQYQFKYTVFPNDLGMDDSAHYMIININAPTKGVKTNGLELGNYAGSFTDTAKTQTIFEDFGGTLGFTPLNQVTKLDVLRYGHLGTPGAPQRPFLSVPRNTRRIAESIVLHMPQGLIYRQDNEYENVELTSMGGKLGIQPLQKAIDVGTALSKVMQSPVNPAVEIVFANTRQRQFTFDLLCAPRNIEESIALKKIYTTLKFHGSPEINPDRLSATWIPPADFDITFFHYGRENLNLPRINTCVLETLVLDPMPLGTFATFSNGYPVAWRLGLGFRELEPAHKQRVLQGF